MRRLRWLLPVAILAIIGAVGSIYVRQRAEQDRNRPERPKLLEPGTKGQAFDWCWDQAQGDKLHVEICATKSRVVENKIELSGVQLKLFHEQATEYDLITSDFAQFVEGERKLFSEGNVAITLAVPAEGAPPGRLLKIHSSGVEFSADTGEATTNRAVSFEFDAGGGSAVGAHYNPAIRELRLDNNVKLDWRGKDPKAEPMHIEAGQAWYFENESRVYFPQWAKLTRSGFHMETGVAQVLLDDGEIKQADVQAARGKQTSPGRAVDFAASDMHLFFDDRMNVKAIQGERDASIVSTASSARTRIESERLDLSFVAEKHESILTGAVASGNSVATAEPLGRAATSPETRVLKSEVIRLAMRPGGEDIDRVETDGPGTLEFLPNRPDQLKRSLKGDRIWINYGAANQIDRFRSINASTRTESKPPRLTESKEILAFFDANSTLTRLEQNTDFRYEQGDRRANARRATFEQAKDLLTLEGAASTSDPSGKVNAERITLDQKAGSYTAEGNVSTTRQPTRKAGSSGMLSSEEVMQATAKRMTSTDNNQKIRYEGDAKAWQGANRVTADRLDIDQQTQIMEAHGKVETQLADKSAKTGPAPFTTVRSQDLVYNSETHVADYTGGVHMERPSLTVDSRDLRAFLTGDSSLEKAFADGSVKIVSTAITPGKGKRLRTGKSEHAEYYAGEQRVYLSGGNPVLEDTEKGRTTGCELTWWANNDRLQVVGSKDCPVNTVVPKK